MFDRLRARMELTELSKTVSCRTVLFYLDDMYGEWDVDSACLWFDKAIAVDSLNPIPYVKYATVMSRKDMDKAKEKLEELRLAVPDYNVDIEIAMLYNKQGKDAEAAAAMANVDPNTLTMNDVLNDAE